MEGADPVIVPGCFHAVRQKFDAPDPMRRFESPPVCRERLHDRACNCVHLYLHVVWCCYTYIRILGCSIRYVILIDIDSSFPIARAPDFTPPVAQRPANFTVPLPRQTIKM